MERTLILVKPDAVQRGLIGEVLGRLEARGLRHRRAAPDARRRSARAPATTPSTTASRFFAGLVDYITSSPLVAAVLEGSDAIAAARQTMGATRPTEAAPGTIRGDLALEVGTQTWCTGPTGRRAQRARSRCSSARSRSRAGSATRTPGSSRTRNAGAEPTPSSDLSADLIPERPIDLASVVCCEPEFAGVCALSAAPRISRTVE